MSLNILRWKGGFGGDLLMKMISDSITVHTNTKFQTGLSNQGGMVLDFSYLNVNHLRQIDCIAAQEFISNVDAVLLKQELDELIASDQTWWLKSHYYQQTFLTDHVIDIVVDHDRLPFAVSANINKTSTMRTDFNVLVPKITDSHVRYQYSIYNVAKDFVCPYQTHRVIQLKQLFAGWDQLLSVLVTFDVVLDSRVRNIYENWLSTNTKHLPSSTYHDLVQTQNYDCDHPGLTLVERYCLLVLSGRKFQLLDKNEV